MHRQPSPERSAVEPLRDSPPLPVWGAPLVYLVAVLVVTWPLGLAPHRLLVDGHFQWGQVWGTGFVSEALSRGRLPALETDWLDYPLGGRVVLVAWTTHLLAFLFERALPLLAAFNLAALAHLWLAPYAAYLFLRKLTGAGWGALVGGLVFGFGPCAIWALWLGQIDQSSHAWIPLFLLALMLWLERPTVPRMLAYLACCAALLFSHPYGGMATAPLAAVLVLARLFEARDRRRVALRAGLAALAGVVVAVPAFLYLRQVEASLLSPPLLHDLAEPSNGIIPTLGRLWSYELVMHWIPHEGQLMYYVIGLVPLALSVFAFAGRFRRTALFWALVWLGTLSLALGRRGMILGVEVPLPLYLLCLVLPMYRRITSAYRVAIAARLALAVLVSLGTAALLGRLAPRSRLPAALGMVALLLVELFQPGPSNRLPLPVVEVTIPAVYAQLAEDPQVGALLEFPFQLEMDRDRLGDLNQRLMLYQAYHRKPVGMKDKNNLRGTLAAREAAVRTLASACLQGGCQVGQAERDSLARLRRMGFTHLVFHEGWLEPDAERHALGYLDSLMQLVSADTEHGTRLYALAAP